MRHNNLAALKQQICYNNHDVALKQHLSTIKDKLPIWLMDISAIN